MKKNCKPQIKMKFIKKNKDMLGYNSDFIFSVVDIKYHPTLLFDRCQRHFEKPTLEIHRDIINFRHPDKATHREPVSVQKKIASINNYSYYDFTIFVS